MSDNPTSPAGDLPAGPILSMSEAQREAARVNAGKPLVVWPRHRSDHDALSDPNWSVLEVLAWVATQDIPMVSGVMDAVAYGKAKSIDGWTYVAAYLSSDVANYFCRCGQGPHECECVKLAMLKIEREAQRGRLIVTGNKVPEQGTGIGLTQREPIPAIDFIKSELWGGRGGTLSSIQDGKMRKTWTEVSFNSASVLAAWPANGLKQKDVSAAPRGPAAATSVSNLKKEAEQVAKELDARGISIRSVDARVICEHWNALLGSAPQVNMVKSYMTGRKTGRPQK